ncbi:MAG: MoaD/ThiS family protein [Eubacteriaceae bacterium]|nr:MoaD/ThiS family protein [Eubacteriaceae bacterium]
MKIKVKLFATLRSGRGKILDNEYNEGTTVLAVIQDLRIDEKDVAILLVNGRDGLLTTVLTDGDTLSLFPPVGGG